MRKLLRIILSSIKWRNPYEGLLEAQISSCWLYRVLPNCSMKRKVKHFELYAHVTKMLLTLPLFFLYETTSFSKLATNRLVSALAISTKTVSQIYSVKRNFNSVSWINTTLRSYWEIFCLAYNEEIPFPMKASKRSKYPLANFTNGVFLNCSMKRKVKHFELNAHITK